MRPQLHLPTGTLGPSPLHSWVKGRAPRATSLGLHIPQESILELIFPLSKGGFGFGTRELGAHVSGISLVLEGKPLSGKHIQYKNQV